ncbi:hypothetical protein N7501_002944 [Penicillium viridicatum]|nr:hypothetical protein N7501_002944 [Penicillium viridicatum]
MDINITLYDHTFGINLALDTGNFRMYQSEPNTIDYRKCKKGMAGIWTSAPNVMISGISLGFLCTTNILTPDARVIDSNGEIGLKAPKDVILVGYGL